MEEEIDLIQLFQIIMRRRWIIYMITSLFMFISIIYSFFISKPVYQANVDIIIGKEEARYFLEDRYTNSDISLYLQVIKTYEEIAMSRTVRDKVRELTSREEQVGLISVTAKAKPNTQILSITLLHSSPKEAASYANTYAEQFIDVAYEVLPAGDLKFLDKAERPQQPIAPNHIRNILIATVLGGMLSIGIIFILELFGSTIKTRQDVTQCFDCPLIAILPRAHNVSRERYVI